MQRIPTLLSAGALSLGILLVPAISTAAPEAPVSQRAGTISAPYYGESPKPIAKKLRLTPTGGVKETQGVKQLTTTTAVITTYPNQKVQNKGAANIQQLATDTGVVFYAVWAKGTMILAVDNLKATAKSLANKLPGGSVKTFTP